MDIKIESTYTIALYLAGDMQVAKSWLNKNFYHHGLCVTIEPTTFLYTGGVEEGFRIGFVNYPRFPASPNAIWVRALDIAEHLVVECCQKTALLVATDKSAWIKAQVPGASYETGKTMNTETQTKIVNAQAGDTVYWRGHMITLPTKGQYLITETFIAFLGD